MLILGGIVVVALFAALIGPYFINWDDYKATFEREAEKILGQPVKVVGSADARLLPSPSFTFTNVQVGDNEGKPMMTVERFTATMELMPLLQGEIHIIAMKLEKPTVKVAVDDTGTPDWLIRNDASGQLNPEKIVLQGVEVSDGTFTYRDAASGVDLELQHVAATIEAKSLLGPWRIEGSYRNGESAVQFQLTTGRLADDGTIRIKTELTPADRPLAFSADGLVASGAAGLSYTGTYNVTEVVDTAGKPDSEAVGLRSEGSFTLRRNRLVIDKAVLSEGPPDRPASLAGAMTVEIGKNAKFSAIAEARQLDLDRALGKGPSEPVDMGTAAQKLVDWLGSLEAPEIPGSITVTVPVIVVGGAVIQNVRFQALSSDGGWQIANLQARLPGQATLSASGLLSTGAQVGFNGNVSLEVVQPATFAAWWGGRSDAGAGRLLAPFKLSGRANIAPGRFAVDAMETKIGDATIAGSFSWSDANDQHRRLLETDLSGDRLDFVQVKALAEMLVGKDLADTSALADSYAIKLKADELAIADILMREVSVDAGFVDGTLRVRKIDVGDLGGARFSVTSGEIADVLKTPRGYLTAQLNATTLTGLAQLMDSIAPSSGISTWLASAAPSLVPASLLLDVQAPARDGSGVQFRVKLSGQLASTSVDGTVDLAGQLAAWRTADATANIELKSYKTAEFLRQAGLSPVEVDQLGSSRVTISAKGVPEKGLDTSLDGDFGQLTFGAEGKLSIPQDLPTRFSGSFHVDAQDLDPLIRMAGLAIPGGVTGTPLSVKGDVATLDNSADLTWKDAQVADRHIDGDAHLSRSSDGLWQVDGNLAVDEVDLDWIASLGLGFAPLPTNDPAAPWSKTPFSEPTYGRIVAKLNVTTDRLAIGEGLDVTKARFGLSLTPERLEVNSIGGEIAGGVLGGGLAIHNVGGDIDFSGHFDMKGATIEPFVWKRNGRAIVTGTLDLSADFEATGRSPAGLVSTLTGGGALSIHDGQIRYINPQAAILVIRASDLGQPFEDEALRNTFTGYIDAGNLPFGEASGAFAVAGGTVRLKSLTLAHDDTRIVGGGVIDLNTMTVDADWTMTLDPGDKKEQSGAPQVGLVFHGPLDAPSRSIDVLQFASFLNVRQTERIQEILTQEEEARTERERFTREKRKLREEAAERARIAQEEADRRVAIMRTLEAFHVDREVYEEQRAAMELAASRARAVAALKDAAERAMAEKTAADRDAKAAADRVVEAEAAADDAVNALADKQAAEQAAIEAVAIAGKEAAAAKVVADAAAGKANAARGVADEARKTADAKSAVASDSRSAADAAVAEKNAALQRVKTAGERLVNTDAASKDAVKLAAAKDAARADAEKAAVDAAGTLAEATTADESDKAAKIAADKDFADKFAALDRAKQAADMAVKEKEAADAATKAASEVAATEKAKADKLTEALATATAAADSASQLAAQAGKLFDTATTAAKFAADNASARKSAAEAAIAAVPIAATEAAAKRAAIPALEQKVTEAKTVADEAAKVADAADVEAVALRAEADRLAVDAAAKAAEATKADKAVAELQTGTDLAVRLAADAKARADEAAAAAQKAAQGLDEARLAASGLTAEEAAKLALAAETAVTTANAAVTKAKAELGSAEQEADYQKQILAAVIETAKGPDAAAAAAAKAASDAAARAKTAEDASEAAIAGAAGKKDALEAAERAVADAEKAAAVATKAAADASAKADSDVAGARDAASAAVVAQAAVEKAAADRDVADKVAADKATARDEAKVVADAARAVADKALADFATADAASLAASEKASTSTAALDVATADKAAAEKALADAVTVAAAASDKLEATKAAVDTTKADLAAAEDVSRVAADAATAAGSALEEARADKASADQDLATKVAAAEVALKAVKANTPDGAAAEAVAKRASDTADALAAKADAAARTASNKAAAEAVANAALATVTAEREAAEKAVVDTAAALPAVRVAAKEAADLAVVKARAANETLAAIGMPGTAETGGPLEVSTVKTDNGQAADGAQPPVEPPMPPPKPTRKKAVKLPTSLLPSDIRPLTITPIN